LEDSQDLEKVGKNIAEMQM